MNNIFENAYFGKAYKTRNCRKALSEIDEEKLDEITKEYLQLNVLYRCDECEQMFIDMIGEAYKAGYRKAMEE